MAKIVKIFVSVPRAAADKLTDSCPADVRGMRGSSPAATEVRWVVLAVAAGNVGRFFARVSRKRAHPETAMASPGVAQPPPDWSK